MPVMDGLTATRLIRAHENEMRDGSATSGAEVSFTSAVPKIFKPAKIVALTGLASQEAKHEAFTSGIDMFVTKPVRLAELNKILGADGGSGGQDDSPTFSPAIKPP